MAHVNDVARYILERNEGRMSTMKLHKLAYYSQAWSLVWDEKPLFPSRIEAWANGPVTRDLYAAHRGHFDATASMFPGDSGNLSSDEKETIDAVLRAYGHLSGSSSATSPTASVRGGRPARTFPRASPPRTR
ncbi:Panacea domain-containing protein [Corynebacterium mastitidis]|uniref:Panacea domain-containing protein n=1 Tax=Corynebacterium mastitidis TaxID=161890 RepID=UPI001FD19369|nr:type II toxin-antitoxin system antitoxin SocA domain-containing protein [Corynebacterium mastitidis]